MLPPRRLAALLLVLVLGLTLRIWALTATPLWCDEGNNAYFAQLSPARLAEMTRLTHDTDPPAHRLALGVWLGVLGKTAFNLRLLSAVLGTGVIALVYAWGAHRGGHRTGLVAAGLMALSPMAVYYSREAKGYAFVAFFATLGMWLWDRSLDSVPGDTAAGGPPRRRGWLWGAYVLCQVLALGAHYYAALLIAAQGIWLLAAWLAGDRQKDAGRRLVRWTAAQAAAAAILAPWLIYTLGSSLDGAEDVPLERAAYGVLPFLRALVSEVAAGPVAPLWAAIIAAATLALAAGWGVAHRADGQDGRRRTGWLVAGCALPVALAFGLQRLYPFFFPRFLLFVLAPLCILAARGLTALRWHGAVLGAVLVASWLWVLPATLRYNPHTDQDLRPAAEQLRAAALPGDTAVVGYIWQEGILRLYAPEGPTHYVMAWYAPDEVPREMGRLLNERARLWYLTFGTPLHDLGSPVGAWLENNAPRALTAESGAHTLALYLAPCDGVRPGAAWAALSEGIALAYDPIEARVSPGQPLRLDLAWRVSTPPEQPYSAFIHLVDEGGKVWAQSDGAPRMGLEPFPLLAPDETVADCRALFVPRDAPMGRYTLRAGLYDPASGERVPIIFGGDEAADYVELGEVMVTGEIEEH